MREPSRARIPKNESRAYRTWMLYAHELGPVLRAGHTGEVTDHRGINDRRIFRGPVDDVWAEDTIDSLDGGLHIAGETLRGQLPSEELLQTVVPFQSGMRRLGTLLQYMAPVSYTHLTLPTIYSV